MQSERRQEIIVAVAFVGNDRNIETETFELMQHSKKESSEDMILALAGQSKQLSHEPEKFISNFFQVHETIA